MSERDLYSILGVKKDAEAREIKKAYHELSLIHHPDKGGDEEKFKEIQTAYSILGDAEKRQMYDLTGSTSDHPMSDGGGGPGMPFPFGMGGMGMGMGMNMGGFNVNLGNIFGSMFGGGGVGGGPGGPTRKNVRRPKGPNKTHEIPLSLNDFYHGKKLHFDFSNRKGFCVDCQGQGCVNYKSCAECRGMGVKETAIQIGPGIMAMNRGMCGACAGEGRKRGSNCETCEGKGLVNAPKSLDVEIKAGSVIGDVLTFEELCSDSAEFEKPGDLLVRLIAADEDIDVRRDGIHLRHSCAIPLTDSLLGCERVIRNHPKFPEGYTFTIPPGTQSNEVVCVKGYGMPVKDLGPDTHGDLLIHVTVKATEDEKKILESGKAILQSLFQMGAAEV